MLEGLLPIGSVVLLKNSKKRVMVMGVCQAEPDKPDVMWDYCGCLYPEGYLGVDKTFLFNNNQIDKVFFIGFQDEEQFAFKVKIDKIHAQFLEKRPAN